MATRDEERNLVLKRAGRSARSSRSASSCPTWTSPRLPRQACATVVELAHHRELREPNKAEFDQALDAVIRISKIPDVVDRAKRYKKGQT